MNKTVKSQNLAGNAISRQAFSSLYIHVPFCNSKCGYCAFYSIVGGARNTRSAFLSALAGEACGYQKMCSPLSSVYIGGGNPTCLSEGELESVFQTVEKHFTRAPACEVTCESNPETLDEDKIAVIADYGVNRISLGIQSFDEQVRRVLRRAGTLAHLDNIISKIRDAGIENVNLDLIYGAPGQTVETWREDLLRAVEYGVTHISTYELTPEEDAHLFSPGSLSPEEEEERLVAMWEEADKILSADGYFRYEVSNHAMPGGECRHNQDCWHGRPYLGLGPAASSFDGRKRWRNVADLTAWRDGEIPEIDDLPEEQRALEIFAFGLRTTSGWEEEFLKQQTGYDFSSLPCRKALERLASEGLIKLNPGRCIPTNNGLLFADYIVNTILFQNH